MDEFFARKKEAACFVFLQLLEEITEDESIERRSKEGQRRGSKGKLRAENRLQKQPECHEQSLMPVVIHKKLSATIMKNLNTLKGNLMIVDNNKCNNNNNNNNFYLNTVKIKAYTAYGAVCI